MSSGYEAGQKQAKMVEMVRAKAPAPMRIGAGMDDQNQPLPVRDEYRVKKSLTDTFK